LCKAKLETMFLVKQLFTIAFFFVFVIASSHAADEVNRNLRGKNKRPKKSSSDDNIPVAGTGGPVCPHSNSCSPVWRKPSDTIQVALGIPVCLTGQYGSVTRCAAIADVELMDKDNYSCGPCH